MERGRRWGGQGLSCDVSLGSFAAGTTTWSGPSLGQGAGPQGPGLVSAWTPVDPGTVFSRGSPGRELRDEGVFLTGAPPADEPRAGLSWRAACWRSP